MYDVEEHVLRYWEEVTPLAPERSPSSDARMYTQSDLALIQQLKYLIQECGYAPALASALLKNNDVETDLKVRDQLTQVKGQIEEMLHLIEEMKGEQ